MPNRRARFAASILALAIGLSACVSEPTGSLRHTYQTSKTGPDSSSSSTDLVELGYQGDLGSDLQIRASERAAYSDLDVTANGVDSRETRVLNQPSIDLVLRTGALAWTQGFEVQETRTTSSTVATNVFTRTDVLEKLEWSPLDLPKLTAWFSSQADRDDVFVDRRDDRGVLQLEDARGPFSWSYSLELESSEDLRADVTRDRVENIFRATHRDQYFEDRLTNTLSVFVDERDTKTRSPGGNGIPPGQVFPVRGLSLVDTTPQIAILNTTPALIDGDDQTSAGINIGGFASGGQTFWNLGVENLPTSAVDLLLVYTDTDVSLFANQFSFSVWASDDNDFWTLVSGAAPFSYEGAFRRFKIPIPTIKNRYLKIVNTASPPGAPAINVTEIQTFQISNGGAGHSSVDDTNSVRDATWNVSWRATPNLTLGYDVFVGTNEREFDSTTTSDETRVGTGVSAAWTPVEKVSANLRAENEEVRNPQLTDETHQLLTSLLDYTPIETLDFALNYTWTNREVDGDPALRTSDVQVRASQRWYDTLRTDFSVGRNVQVDSLNDRTITRYVWDAQATAELLRHVNVTLGLRHEPASVSGSGSSTVPDPSVDSVEFSVLYQPSTRFTAQTQLEWRDTFAETGLQQRYRVDWLPFVDGSIDVQVDYDRLDGDTLNPALDRFFLLTRWDVNPKAFVEVNAATQIPEFGDRTDSLTVTLNLRW